VGEIFSGNNVASLQAVATASISNGETARIWLNGAIVEFVFDSTATNATSTTAGIATPYYIRPSDYSAAGVWVEDPGSLQKERWGGGQVINLFGTYTDVFIINSADTDIDTELRFGRTTGGTASFTWNGALVQCSKAFKPTELGINNISDTEPNSPFAGQVWVDP